MQVRYNDRVAELTDRSIDPGARIGHVHLKVADLERSLAFYCGVLGFKLTQRYGSQAAFVSAGGYHHHIGLNTWESLRGGPPPRQSTGLYHLAILYSTRPQLALALRRLIDSEIALDGASDHGVSEALYLRDPDDNGVELYWDRPRTLWPRDANGQLAMYTRALDLQGLLAEENKQDGTADLYCAICNLAISDPLSCGDCSATICRRCGTPLEDADELAMG
jgi:catechol 2,3-dioxygenase